MKRLLRVVAITVTATLLGLGGIVGAWLEGWSIPFASGATYLKVTKLHAAYLGHPGGNGAIFIMFIGSDLRPGVGGARGDALHLLAINPKLHGGTILDIPRDTCTNVPGRGSSHRINEANSVGGPKGSADVVGAMVGVKVDYAVELDFAGFVGLVNSVGGVHVDVPFPMHDSYSNANFETGTKWMDGIVALSFARDRHSFGRGDLQRSWNQGYLMIAAVKELQHEYSGFGGRFQLAANLVRHARLSGLSISDLVRLGNLGDAVPAAAIKNVTIPLQGGGCLDLAPSAAQLFADFRDDGVLQSYPAGTPQLPDPRP